MKVAIISRPENKSPKVLAQSLKHSFIEKGVDCKIFYDTGFLHRKTPLLYKGKHYRANWHFKLRQRLKFYFNDQKLLKELKSFDAIVLCECIPNAYWYNYYGILQIKKIIRKPFGLYEVFFLDSSPRFKEEILNETTNYKSLFDFEFAISSTSYTKTTIGPTKFEVGLNLKASEIGPIPKNELIALVDFHWEGCDNERKIQKQALKEVGIKTKELAGSYTVEEIRELYKESSLLFIQHFESFGLPIAECLGYGAKIVTPHSGWPMAFRLDQSPAEYGQGTLPECFLTYKDKDDLVLQLNKIKSSFNTSETPMTNFKSFFKYYPHFYQGSEKELDRFITSVNQNNIKIKA